MAFLVRDLSNEAVHSLQVGFVTGVVGKAAVRLIGGTPGYFSGMFFASFVFSRLIQAFSQGAKEKLDQDRVSLKFGDSLQNVRTLTNTDKLFVKEIMPIACATFVTFGLVWVNAPFWFIATATAVHFSLEQLKKHIDKNPDFLKNALVTTRDAFAAALDAVNDTLFT